MNVPEFRKGKAWDQNLLFKVLECLQPVVVWETSTAFLVPATNPMYKIHLQESHNMTKHTKMCMFNIQPLFSVTV